MKKFLAVVLAALVIALAIWVAWRVQQANRQMQVSELLPKTTLLLAEVPDLKRTREQWHASDIYALWHEPAVQAALEKPLAKLSQRPETRAEFERFSELEPTSLFFALSSLENNEPIFLAGFHFEKPESDARRFIEDREAPLLAKSGSSKRETISYREHQIQTVNAGRFALATVYDRNWFFAANNLAALKALLDRADRHTRQATENTLRESEIFEAAAKQLPKDFTGMFFVDPQPFLAKLTPLFALAGQNGAATRLQQLKSIRSFAGALDFQDGKMREILYAAMPQQHAGEKLARPALEAASKDAFLYSASLASWPEAWQLTPAVPAAATAQPAFVRQMADAFARAGVSSADLGRAFGNNVELLGEWPQSAHWPQLVLTVPVHDAALARKALDALSSGGLFGGPWTRSDRDGVSFYGLADFGGFVPIHPTLALSANSVVAASDPAAAEALLQQEKTKPTDALLKSETFQKAEARVGAGETGFSYLDPKMLFERTDAAVRPLLLMGATFYPGLAKKFDISKLPPAEVIAKHLSPVVMSQRWTGDGYLAESVGPVTFNEAALGLGVAFAAGYYYYQNGLAALTPAPAMPTTPPPSIAPATPTPTSTPP